ncbi:siderophore-interacting protein [Nocardioides sp.]|uniref:siderophore-interacting protein n=1 Tax=Nocardioides sp. TaxID=35761 RepID=UPI0037830932
MAVWHATVRSASWLTPALVRVVLRGDGLSGFATPDATDTYVNLAFPPADAPYGPVFAPAEVREHYPAELWPARRRYTVRRWEPATESLTLDFVVHGDDGVGGPWAASAAPGDVLVMEGPGGSYRPDPAAACHLLAGDESALPAVAASLEAVPAGQRAVARIVCDGPEHEVDLSCPGELDLRWLHRTGSGDAELLLRAVEDLDLPASGVQAFVHGEADEIRGVRRHLLVERGLTRADMSCSPYWRRTMTDEAWRRVKRDFVAQMDADVEPVA